jgi:hypothetical protein
MRSRIFGFKNKYPQSFLDSLAKAWGFEWTKVRHVPIDRDKVEVKPMGPPSAILYYCEIKYNEDKIS